MKGLVYKTEAFACSKSTIETLEQYAKSVEINNKEPEQMIKIIFEVLQPGKHCNKTKHWLKMGLALFWEGEGGGKVSPRVQNRKSY